MFLQCFTTLKEYFSVCYLFFHQTLKNELISVSYWEGESRNHDLSSEKGFGPDPRYTTNWLYKMNKLPAISEIWFLHL